LTPADGGQGAAPGLRALRFRPAARGRGRVRHSRAALSRAVFTFAVEGKSAAIANALDSKGIAIRAATWPLCRC
jgi:hypothetical protein